MSDRTETPAARAAREEFANDLKDMSMDRINREIEDVSRVVDDETAWLEALIAEREHRQRGDT